MRTFRLHRRSLLAVPYGDLGGALQDDHVKQTRPSAFCQECNRLWNRQDVKINPSPQDMDTTSVCSVQSEKQDK